MQIAEQLRLAGVPTFPCWVRFDPAKGRWAKGPFVPKDESWNVTASRPFNDPVLNWSSGVCGIPLPRGVVVFDLDAYKGATTSAIEQLLGCQLPWAAAHIQNTINGGQHFAFYADWDVRQGDSINDLQGFDTRVAGKGFICSGEGYAPVGFGPLALAYPTALPRLPDSCRAVLENVKRELRTADPQAPTEINLDQLIAALRHINPGGSRADWLRVGLALRNYFRDDEILGLDIFDQWSAGAFWHQGCPHNYVQSHVHTQWPGFSPDGETTAATLFYKAIQGGWRPPVTFDTSAAFGASAATPDTYNALLERVIESGGDTRQTASIVDEIRAAGCNALQVALLAAELKMALKDAGIKDAAVGKHIDSLLTPTAALPPRMLPGELPAAGGGFLDPNTPLHPSAWAPYQTKGKDMKPKATARNFEIMMQAYGVNITFDEIGKTVDITGPTTPGNRGVLREEAALGYLDSIANLNEYPTGSLSSMILTMANNNTVNPVRDWVASVTWDGQDHVGALFAQLKLTDTEDRQFCELLFRKWMRGAYSIGTGAISRWEHVIVLIDPHGGAGKTRFFSTLCPRELRTDSVILDTSDKDSVKMAVSYFLTELGELDGTFDKSASHKLKAFLSMEKDEMRLAYGRTYLKYPRRTAFFASVNEPHFLRDPSDNRRWWAMEVRGANHLHKVNVLQAWAQAAAECAMGYEVFLNEQEKQILTARNESFRSGSRIADRLARAGIVEGTSGDHKTLTEILELAGVGNPTRAEIDECGQWLRRVLRLQQVKVRGVRGYNVTLAPKTAAAFMTAVGGAV